MKKNLTLFFTFLITVQFSFALWEPINNGLFSGTFRCFAVKDGKIYAGATDYALLYSTDNGLSWHMTGEESLNTRSLATIGNTLIAATWGSGVFLSTDEGKNWVASNSGLSNLYVVSVFVKNGTILAGTWGDGIYISTDNGSSWVQSDFKYGRPYAFASNDVKIFAATDKGLIISTDNGSTWSNTVITNVEIYSVAVENNFVVIGTTGAIYYSLDGGENWVRRQIPLVTVQGLAIDGNFVFAATNKGLLLSTDNGNSWTLKSKNELFESTFAVLYYKGNIIVGTYEKGIYLSQDFGDNWFQVGGDIKYFVYSLTTEGSKVFLGTEKGILVASNYGEHWFPTNATLKKINVLHSCNSYIFAGAPNAIFFTTDLGVTWSESILGSNVIYNVLTISCNSDYVFASGEGAFYAFSKFPVKFFTVDVFYFQVNSIVLIDQEIYFASTNGVGKLLIPQKIFVPLGLEGKFVNCLIHTDGKLLAGTNDGLYVSTDYGSTWVKKSNGLSEQIVYSVAAWNNIYFAGTPVGVYVSTDYGENWEFSDKGFINSQVLTIHIAYPYVFVGSLTNGVYRARLDDFITSVESVQPAKNLLLYPNPSNDAIHIVLSENYEPAEIDIFNNLGISQKICVDIKRKAKDPISVDITNLPKGMYYIKIVTIDGKILVKKFVKC